MITHFLHDGEDKLPSESLLASHFVSSWAYSSKRRPNSLLDNVLILTCLHFGSVEK